MALGNGNVELKVTLDAQGVVTGIQSIAKAENDLKQTTEQTSQGFTTFQSTLITLNQALDLGARAFGFLKSAGGAALEAISKGSDIDDVASAFDKLTKKAGGLADVFLNDLRTATAGTIDDFHLQQQAIEAVRAGAKPDEFVELAKAARVLADESGTNLTDELGQLSQAMETGRAGMLKMKLGTIDTQKAENELASQLGITRDLLSKEGQVLAARNAIMEAAKAKAQDFNAITIDSGDVINQLKTSISNASDKMYVAIGTNDDLKRSLLGIRDAINQINWKSVVDGLTSVINFSSHSAQGIAKIPAFFEALYGALMDKGMQRDIAAGTKTLDDAIDLAVLKMAQAEVDFDTHSTGIKDSIKSIGEEAAVTFGPANNEGIATFLQLTRSTSDALVDQVALKQKQADIDEKIAAQRKQDIDDLKREAEIYARINEEIAQQQQQLGTQIGDALAGSVSAAFSGGNHNDISKGIKDSLAPLSKAGGAMVGGEVGFAIGGPIGAGIGAAIGAPISEAIDGAIIDGIFGAFNSTNAQTEARKGVDKFFSEVFKDNPLQAIMGQQLSTITDLNFGGAHGFDNGGFGKIFDSIEPAAREAFRGVGVAMNELLGTGEDIGSQLGHVFAENLGGDLNNLQLLVQATGKTFEEMKNSVVEAFLDGKLSALEAQTAINGVREVMEVGIPGAVGATTQAFDNLIKSTAKGGRATVDAIGDIAAEAEEKGVPSLAALQVELEGAFDKEKVDAFFKSVAEFGITTIDQLKNSTVETRLALAATLEGQGSFFDVAQAKVDDIVNKLNSIPDHFESDYTINVKLNGTSEAQTIGAKAIGGVGVA